MANVLQRLFGDSKIPEWARKKIDVAMQNRSSSLDLNGFEKENKLTEIPKAVFNMTWLESLDLKNNKLTVIPSEIAQLRNLQSLNLRDNGLMIIPASIIKLKNLQSLNLRGNWVTTIPQKITQLKNLRSLDLDGNRLTTVPPEIAKLESLQFLELGYNRLMTVSPKIAKLKNLQRLVLGANQLTVISLEITQLENLQLLDLKNNKLTTIPPEIAQLQNLQSLTLGDNQLTSVPSEIAQLKNLQTLGLGYNQLAAIPPEIAQLKDLQSLDLRSNRLTDIPPEMTRLQNLQSLDLDGNELTNIPAWLAELPKLEKLYLYSNPIQTPPLEVLELNDYKPIDLDKLRAYFRQLKDDGDGTLYEAKLIILGEAGAGKTTLVKKLLDPTYPVNPAELSTEGIDVAEWHFDLDLSDLPSNTTFRVNLWDFGGQEIYHATHKFFLTRRSLYILVADAREQKTDFYYWLNVVELLSDNSPALIVSNEKQNRAWPFNENQLRGEFSSLKEAFPVNLADNDNRRLNQIIEAIKYHIVRLPHVGQTLPKTWVRVREALEADPRNTMPLHEYLDLCEQQGFKREEDKLQLSDYLHDLGVCLHFQDDPLLNKTLILKPEWGTAAVYAVLEDEQVNGKRGRFSRADLKAIWHEEKYIRWRDELLQLMIRFELCYPLPAPADAYIIPQLLSENRPAYPWAEENNLFLRYRYPAFMPKGILTRFIVVTHRLIADQQWVWKTGVILADVGCVAEIIEHYQRREITIRVSGGQKRELLTKIGYEFEKIHADFPRLQFKQLIPCNCSRCAGNAKPYFFDFERLKKRLAAGKSTTECDESYETVDVWGLIDDVGARQQAITGGGIQVGGDYIHIEGNISNVRGMGIGREAHGSSSRE